MNVDANGHVFRVLGPVQAATPAGPVTFARRQQLDLLALLLLHAGQVLTTERIVDLMWGASPPQTAASQIKNMISGLRAVLPEPSNLDRTRAGYRLTVPDGELDLAVFSRLSAQARSAASPAEAASLLRHALTLWHGAALGGVRAAFAGPARAQLDEQRLAATEALFEAELECGRHTEIVAELTDAVSANPGRENLVAQLMLCLYRCGRPTDALTVYRRARQNLVEDYGLEPGQRLRHLERLILGADSSLSLLDSDTAAESAPGPKLAVIPAQLPLEPHGFAGRADELARLSRLLSTMDTVVVSVILGTAGVGKTALALHWAHKVAPKFPDGQLYINLRGFDPDLASMTPAEAIRCFLHGLGVDPRQIPSDLTAQAALYRSLMAGRKMLVLLDNAVSAEQVRPLLPGSPGSLVLVTSRNRLSGLVSAEGAHPLTLGLMSYADSRDLLVARLGAERVEQDEEAATEIVHICARLPLALAMVAARAAISPGFSLTAFSGELAQVLAGGGSGTDVHSVFSWSYQRLAPGAAGMFRWLSLHPGTEISAAAAASLSDVPIAEATRLLGELSYAHLIAERAPGWFSMHALLRGYAMELVRACDSEAWRHSAMVRLTGHYLHSAHRAASLLYPHRHQISLVPPMSGVVLETPPTTAAASAWFGNVHQALAAMVELAAQCGLATQSWQLAFTIAGYLDRQGHWQDWVQTQQAALTAAQVHGDLEGQAWAHSGLGLAYGRQRDYAQAKSHLSLALELLGQLGDRLGQAYAHLRMTAVCDGTDSHGEALRHARQAFDLYRRAGHRAGQAQALNTLGWYLAQLGRLTEAVLHCEQALALHRELRDQQGAAHTLDSLGFACFKLGDFAKAAANYRESAQVLGETGDRYFEAVALTHLGEAYQAGGELASARQAWKQSLHILQELGHEDTASLAARLLELDECMRSA